MAVLATFIDGQSIFLKSSFEILLSVSYISEISSETTLSHVDLGPMVLEHF
jgi:hypothetical protein